MNYREEEMKCYGFKEELGPISLNHDKYVSSHFYVVTPELLITVQVFFIDELTNPCIR